MQFRVSLVKTKDGRGTFALVDVASSGGSYRGAGVTRTYHTASQMERARREARTVAKRYYDKHKTAVTGPMRICDV